MCPKGYTNLWSDSTHCYRVADDKVTWIEAKVKCQVDDAELACFPDKKERDTVSEQCDGCWVGYKWMNG